MAINFTDSPADGATQVIGGRTYTYNSAKNKWDTTATEVVGPTATVYATVDTLPETATTGDQAFVSSTNRLYIWNGSGWYNIALINTNPTISGVSSSYDLATDGTATTVTITATDPEGLPITYSIASDTSGSIATVTQGTGASSNVFTITPSTSDANAGTFSLTFRASDGVNVATAPASFTLQFQVQNSNYTTALITSVGENNAVNNAFVDSSTNSHTITATGNATQTTFSPYRHGGYSVRMDGGDRYTLASSADWNLGSSWTIEGWFRPTAQPTESCRIFMFGTNGGSAAMGLGLQSDMTWGGGGAFPNGGMFNLPQGYLNEWQHVAWVRDGSSNTGTIYVNGVASAGSYSGPAVQAAGNVDLKIGYDTVSTVAYQYQGNIADVRITKSVVYSSNFTPPERFTSSDALTDTKLLAFHTPYLKDESGNNHNFTITGNPKIVGEGYYDYEKYSASTNGGSMYFDGSGDGVEAPNHTSFDIGSGDFTIETWLYSSNPDNGYIFGKGDGATAGGTSFWMSGGSGSGLYLFHGGSYTIMQSGALPVNQWTHLAFVRNGTNLSTYVNGKSVHSTTASITVNTTSNVFDIANYPSTAWIGNLEDFRFVKGTAVYTSDFTPPTSPLTAITNTSLLLSGTNAGIIDKSQSVQTLTLNGDVKSSTTQSKYLTSSMYFDGTGDYIILSDSDAREFGGEDLTIELWFKTSIATQYATLISNTNVAFAAGCWSLMMNNTASGGEIAVYMGDIPTTGFLFETTGVNVRDDAWHHLALVRNGNAWACYVDGTSRASTTFTGSITNINADICIGADQYYGRNWQGYMSDVRITKGLARYTTNFTPPSAALDG